ncbi:uncharacterized protein sb:cb288 isoform X2 [Labrus bergylta]|uniref:uncharacterized protein sb:cb288 isoform X2 n=1 Tax=Labrus bergylta TaxID=56723 RepID=UPI003313973E
MKCDPQSLGNVDGDEKHELDCHQRWKQLEGSTAASTRPSHTEESLTRTSGIIPGAIAATLFIAFLLALYAVLWKCMVSPPQRKHRKVRVRIKQRSSV